jgi:hypothetical protein
MMAADSDARKVGSWKTPQVLAYVPPTLDRIGKVEELTQGTKVAGNDGGVGKKNSAT